MQVDGVVSTGRASRISVCANFPEVELRRSVENQAGWDLFAQACDATFRGAYRSASMWQLKFHLVFSLRRFDILIREEGRSIKAGQFAVGFGRNLRVFCDTLQLLPNYKQLWSPVMRRVLGSLGPGVYFYGSDWTTEPSRSLEFGALPDVIVLKEKCIDIYAVDFSEFTSWEQYHQAISKNARRNEVAAVRAGGVVLLNMKNKNSVFEYIHLFILKNSMFKRKRIVANLTKSVVASVWRYLILKPHIFTAKTVVNRRTQSIFCGLTFGRDMYYLEGASVDRPGGAAWQLLITMLRVAYNNSGGLGKCVLGPDDGSERGNFAWENLRRQRLQCRARPFATSIVKFAYAGADLKRAASGVKK